MTNILLENETLTSINDNIKLIQNKNGLTFGTDAFLLASYIKEQKNCMAVELGGGTGIISLLCASRGKFSKIHCLEIQEDFANIIERNAQLNELSDKVISICKDIREFRSIDLGYEVDVVFSNPPYMKADSGKRNEHDEKYIARHEVCGNIDDFCASAKRLLKHGGFFYCVWYKQKPVLILFLKSARRLLKNGGTPYRGVVQFGRTLGLGPRSRMFKSCRPDHLLVKFLTGSKIFDIIYIEIKCRQENCKYIHYRVNILSK